MKPTRAQQGFTLIELVVVIVILGILAATALPRFINLSGDAELAARQGLAGAINSACAMNFAQNQLSAGVPLLTTAAAAISAVNIQGTINYTLGTDLIFTPAVANTSPCSATAN